MKIPTLVLGIGLLLVSACGSSDGESASTDAGNTTTTAAPATATTTTTAPPATTTTTEDPGPESSDETFSADRLQVCGVVNIDDNGGGEYVVMFEGDCEAASEGYYDLSVFVTVNSQDWAPYDDKGISERCGYRVREQVPFNTTCSRDDREDGQSGLEQFPSEVEWTGRGELTYNATGTKVTDGSLSAIVTIVEKKDGFKDRQDYKP